MNNTVNTLKGQSNEICDPRFLSSFEPPLTKGLKYFRFGFRYRRDIPIFLNPQYDIGTYCAESAFSRLKWEYLGENETKFENVLFHSAVAQAGLIYLFEISGKKT